MLSCLFESYSSFTLTLLSSENPNGKKILNLSKALFKGILLKYYFTFLLINTFTNPTFTSITLTNIKNVFKIIDIFYQKVLVFFFTFKIMQVKKFLYFFINKLININN